MNNFIKLNPPKWLTEIGTQEEQKEHLKDKVLVHVFERFAYVKQEKQEDFIRGFRMKI
jgi:hypothetical protein